MSPHRRSIVIFVTFAALGVIAFSFILKAVVLHGQTGAYTIQPYEWYSAENQGIRSFSYEVPLSHHNATARCLIKPSSPAPVSSSLIHRRRQALGPPESTSIGVPQAGDLRRVLVYVHNADIFPWLWDSLLDTGTPDELLLSGSYSSQALREPGKYMPIKRKVVADENLELVLVDGDPAIAMQNTGIIDLIVVAWEMPTSFIQSLPDNTHVGLVVASFEYCVNPSLDARVKFALLT